MATLARKLNLWNYFALGFGTMIGTGWVVVMDDWLGRGGSVGAMLGFAAAGVLLLPVSYVYGEWVKRLPDASGEAAYTAQVFPPLVSYITGWVMFPRLVLGAALTIFLAWLNYRGIRASATFQNWTTTAVLVLFLFLVAISGHSGHAVNLRPYFSHAPLISVLLTLQIVPYFITGFESVPKVAEESHPGFPSQNFFKAIAMALLVGAGFYVLAVGAVAYIAPWPGLVGKRFATAIAFEQGTHSSWIARFILGVSLIGLLQVFNGNFVAATRLLFAYGRRQTIPSVFAKIDAQYQTPSVAIAGVTVGTLIGLLVGDALLVPVTEVGSMASAFGWLAACLSLYMVDRTAKPRILAGIGVAVSLLLVLMKWLPNVPGHFTLAEWIALCAWLVLGLLFHASGGKA
jgi:basic amino acid/polyamine antiporter, APA family